MERTALIGGMARVREVLRGLWTSCTSQGLTEALEALQEIPTAQRLGALLTLENQSALAARVADWLGDKPLRLVPLERGQTRNPSSEVDTTFKVRLTSDITSAST
ncbi:MAG: hypothetical protein AMXMBFR76_10240 [Pseudomonadota bacterium]